MPTRRKSLLRLSRPVAALFACLAATAALSACSWLPSDLFDYGSAGGEYDTSEYADAAENDEFPSLGEVPDTPRPSSSQEARERLAQGLIADRENARYTEQTLRSRYEEAKPTEADLEPPQTVPSTEHSAVDAIEPPRPEPISAELTTPEPAPARAAEPASALTPSEQLAADRRIDDAGFEEIPVEPQSDDVATGRRLSEERAIERIEPASEAVLAAREVPTAPPRRQESAVVEQPRDMDSVYEDRTAYTERMREQRALEEEGSAEDFDLPSTDALIDELMTRRRIETESARAAEPPAAETQTAMAVVVPEAAAAGVRPPEDEMPASTGPPATTTRGTTVEDFKQIFRERFAASGRPAQPAGAQELIPTIPEPFPTSPPSEVRAAIRPQTMEPDGAPYDIELAGLDPMEPPPTAVVPEEEGSADFDFDQAVASSDTDVSFLAGAILFGDGSARVSDNDRKRLKNIVDLHRELGGTVRVVGHASQRTPDMHLENHKWTNFLLSMDRANAVALELAQLGVPAEALQVDARSDNEPLSYEYMPAGEAENRRAEIFIEY